LLPRVSALGSNYIRLDTGREWPKDGIMASVRAKSGPLGPSRVFFGKRPSGRAIFSHFVGGGKLLRDML
jgi:hypothetical protein